jgi:SAM-dependent methyltransferase
MSEPTLDAPVWQRVTQEQCESTVFGRWCEELKTPARLHRKLWEWVYIMRVLETQGVLRDGAVGLGFGVGREPLAAAMAARGCTLLATDKLMPGWEEYYAHSVAELDNNGVCDPKVLVERVELREVDMREIPPDLGSFDFIWSSCAIEHLGSLEAGLDFVRETLPLLKPGGVAVHTTELNVRSDTSTLASGPIVLYREQDVFRFHRELTDGGFHAALNLTRGDGDLDERPNLAAGPGTDHLCHPIGGFVTTSFGMRIARQ